MHPVSWCNSSTGPKRVTLTSRCGDCTRGLRLAVVVWSDHRRSSARSKGTEQAHGELWEAHPRPAIEPQSRTSTCRLSFAHSPTRPGDDHQLLRICCCTGATTCHAWLARAHKKARAARHLCVNMRWRGSGLLILAGCTAILVLLVLRSDGGVVGGAANKRTQGSTSSRGYRGQPQRDDGCAAAWRGVMALRVVVAVPKGLLRG